MTRESIGYWRGEIGQSNAGPGWERRTMLQDPPIVQGVPTRMGGGYRVETAVGLGNGAFGVAGLAVVLQQQSMVPFRPRRLVIEIVEVGQVAAGLLLVTSFFAGNLNLFANAAAHPAGAFAADSVGPMLVSVPVTPAMPFILEITRTAAAGSGCDVLVAATLFGEAI